MATKMVPMVGLFGGPQGTIRNIESDFVPAKLESMNVWYDYECINGIKFTYVTEGEKQITTGIWGNMTGSYGEITIEQGEYMKMMEGTTDGNRVTYLKFTTSKNKEYIFGDKKGHSFSVPMFDGGAIVAFFARADDFVKAIGVYVSASQPGKN